MTRIIPRPVFPLPGALPHQGSAAGTRRQSTFRTVHDPRETVDQNKPMTIEH